MTHVEGKRVHAEEKAARADEVRKKENGATALARAGKRPAKNVAAALARVGKRPAENEAHTGKRPAQHKAEAEVR
ncbi:hypothetical protein T492DRAFT_886788 [Pavlovales sp. CCMP2436]|nr:hypothetical protein T492DRAFT_886788 [Pavlovales sp. CCMP2436]